MALKASLDLTTHVLEPELEEMLSRVKNQRGNRVKKLQIWRDYVYDNVELGVTFHLFDGNELRDESYKRTFWPRIAKMISLKDPLPAKTIRVERRQLKWRGEQATKSKPRRIR